MRLTSWRQALDEKPEPTRKRYREALAGNAFAAFVALDLFRGTERWTFFASVLVITGAKIGWVGVDAMWILLACAGTFFVYGLLHRATHAADGDKLAATGMSIDGLVVPAPQRGLLQRRAPRGDHEVRPHCVC